MVLNEQLLQLAAVTHPCTHAEFLPSFSDVAIALTRVRSRSRRYLNPFLHADTVMGMIKSCRCDATVSKVTKTCSFPKLNRALWCLNLPRPWAQCCYNIHLWKLNEKKSFNTTKSQVSPVVHRNKQHLFCCFSWIGNHEQRPSCFTYDNNCFYWHAAHFTGEYCWEFCHKFLLLFLLCWIIRSSLYSGDKAL